MAPATRGLLSGVIFFLSLSLITTLCMLFPHSFWGQSWLVEKTVLGEEFCWFGEGIWETNVVWGDDTKLHCSRNKPKLFQNAYHEYCSSPSKTWFSRPDAMCSTVQVGRGVQISAMALTACALAFAARINMAKDVPGMRFGAWGSIVCLVVSITLGSYLIYLMLISPLFDEYHALHLGKKNQVNYRGLGCVFQSPFVHGPQHLVQSAPLKCVYPGPAVVFVLGTVLLQIMAVLALLALLYSFHGNDGVTIRYSLHGAFMRKLTQYHRFEQYLVALVVPLMALGNGILLVAWFYNGMQFVLVVKVRMWGKLVMEMREQVFSFDPVTTLQDFWSGKGYFVAIITLVWLDLFPFFKILLWLYFWFIPTNEVLRGRVFSWIDYLGRWSLVTLFSLCIMTLGFLFSRDDMGAGPLNIELHVIVAKGNGVTWFLVALLWTVLLGNVSMLLHSFAKQWEEQRSTAPMDDVNAMDTPAAAQGSLFGEIVRRFSLTSPSITQEHQREAIVYMPVTNHHGMKKIRFSKAGRRTVAISILVLFFGMLVAASMPLMTYVRSGAVPTYLLQDRESEFSLFSMTGMVKSMGGTEQPAYFMQVCFTMFSIVVPLLHCVGLWILFFVPQTLHGQQRVFRMVEFLDTWNALDVFAMAVFVAWLGFESISRSIVAIVVPGMTEVSRRAIHDEVFTVDPQLHHPGFAVLVCMVLLQKGITHFLMEFGAAGITQRQVIMHRNNGEVAAERAVLLFSPAARYYNTDMDAARLPSFVWRALSRAGLMREM